MRRPLVGRAAAGAAARHEAACLLLETLDDLVEIGQAGSGWTFAAAAGAASAIAAAAPGTTLGALAAGRWVATGIAPGSAAVTPIIP